MTQLSGKRVLVVGLGVTGLAVVRALGSLLEQDRPKSVVTLDSKNLDATFSVASAISFDDIDLVVTSPGWAPSTEVLSTAAALNIPIWSEIELAWHLRVPNEKTGVPAPWLGVTGTNGKTTTVQMLESILAADSRNAVAVGNVGKPVIEAALDPTLDVLALELSSFQLHYTHSMELVAGAVLNIAADHLDWHGSLEEYAKAKGRVFEHVQTACVYNVSDPMTRVLVENADVADGARAVGFTLGAPGRSEVGLIEDVLCDRAFHMASDHPDRHNHAAELATLADLEHLAGPGGMVPPHVVANALAAAALARAAGVSTRAVRDGLRNFHPGGHRIALVASTTRDGSGNNATVSFVDDSKATNAHAAAASLDSFDNGKVIWIAGGLAKGASFDSLVATRSAKMKAVVVIGVDQAPMLGALERNAPELPVTVIDPAEAETVMARAVRAAFGYAEDGDVILMAPACASMDQFVSYADRGNAFTTAARALVDETSSVGR